MSTWNDQNRGKDMIEHKRSAIVTGGGRGIGKAIVDRLAEDGFAVMFTYQSDENAARSVEKSHQDAGRAVRAFRADQADIDAVSSLFQTASAWFGKNDGPFLDVLVCSAGIIEHAPIESITPEMFDRVMGINARGTLFTMQQAGHAMRENGRVVCISTIGTAWPSAGEAVYAASKAAVEQFARVASREWGARGITVNVVSPGPTDTDLLRRDADEETLTNLTYMTALRRLGRPSDIAGIVGMLVDESQGWVTGQNIRADGGLV